MALSLQPVLDAVLSEAKDLHRAEGLQDTVVLVRVDYNVPIFNGKVAEYFRVDSSLPTIQLLQQKGAKVVLLAHLGRPKPEAMSQAHLRKNFSLSILAEHLQKQLGRSFVGVCGATVGPDAERAVRALKSGQVVLLENTRFHAEEEACDPAFTAALAALGSIFVNDAFGVCHRDQSSVSGLARSMRRCYPGLLVRREVQYLSGMLSAMKRPFAVVIGGAKVADKIGVLWEMLERADKILIGGRMAFTFLAARGVQVGQTSIERDWLERAARMLEIAEKKGVQMMLPTDVVCTYDLDSNDPCCTRPLTVGCCTKEAPCIPSNAFGADIGPKTCSAFVGALQDCSTIFWNGPMGRFEIAAYSNGTEEVAFGIAQATSRGATTVVGGGDSVTAVKQLGIGAKMSHLSTGGGASLELLEGKGMPGLRALVHDVAQQREPAASPDSPQPAGVAV